MRIETNSIKSNIVFTAILIHVIIIFIAPALSLLGILYINSRATRRNPDASSSFMLDSSGLIPILVSVSIILTIALSGYLYYRNYNRKYIVAFEFDDVVQTAGIFYKTYYKNKIRKVEISYKGIDYISKITSQNRDRGVDASDLMVDDKIQILDNKKYMGEISMGGTYWNKEGGKIKMVIKKIEEIRSLQKS